MHKTEMTSKELYFRLLRYVLPYWRVFAISVLTMIITAGLESSFPALLKPMLDGSFVHKDPATIQIMPYLLVGLFLARGLIGYVSSYTISLVKQPVIRLNRLIWHAWAASCWTCTNVCYRNLRYNSPFMLKIAWVKSRAAKKIDSNNYA